MDLQELKKYRPIPRGGLKLLAGVVVIFFACVGVGFLLEESTTAAWAWLSAGGLFTTMLTIVAILSRIDDYWRRNVKGCSIAVFRDDAGNCQMEGPHTREIIRVGMKLWGRIVLILPLGGWFNRAYILCSENYVGKSGISAERELSKWRVEVVDIHTQAIVVRLIDRRGDRVTVSAKDALEILERFSARLEAFTNTWDAVVSHGLIVERVFVKEHEETQRVFREHLNKLFQLVDAATGHVVPPTGEDTADWTVTQVRRLITERDEAKRKLKEALAREGEEIGRVNKLAWKYAELLMHVIDRLDATKRFIKSRQALEIRKELMCELHQCLPSGDSRRKKYGLPTAMGCALGRGGCEAAPSAAEAREGG
jgi:hypothetical protein